jgi:hypothetical protein
LNADISRRRSCIPRPGRAGRRGPVAAIGIHLALAATTFVGTARIATAQPAPAPAVPSAPPAAPPVRKPNPTVATLSATLDEQQTRAAALEQALAQQKQDLEALRAQIAAGTAKAADETARRETSEAALTTRVTAAETRAAQEPLVGSKLRGLTLSGFVHADVGFRQSSEDELNGSTGDPLNEDRFSIRRARLRAAFDDRYVGGVLEIDGNTTRGTTARLIGAEASLKLPGAPGSDTPLVMGTVGLFKIPFGYEVLQSDRDRTFLERSTVVRALFPGEYDAGARLAGGWRFLRYALAVQNGEPIGERGFALRDPNQAKDVVGRIGLEASIVATLAGAVGVSGVKGRGFHKGTPSTKTTLTFQDRNEDGRVQQGEILVVPGSSATAAQQFSRHALGVDGRVSFTVERLGQTTVYGELILASNLDRAILVADPFGAAGRDQRELGYYGAVTQDVGQHLTLGVRYDFYNPDRDSAGQEQARAVPQQRSYKSWALAAALRARSGRLIFEYDLNRNHLGRDSAGLPANLKDNAFTVRAEMKF